MRLVRFNPVAASCYRVHLVGWLVGCLGTVGCGQQALGQADAHAIYIYV